MIHYHNNISRHAKKTTRKRVDFIYGGDTCFFKRSIEVFPADENFNYEPQVLRTIWPGDPLTYIKRKKEGKTWIHCFESYGLQYVHKGPIKDFTKDFVPYRED